MIALPALCPDQDNVQIDIRAPADVLETLQNSNAVEAVILDPWYNKGVGGIQDNYHDWLEQVIVAASRISSHIFVWGFPEILAHQIPRIPSGFRLTAWLTWYYKNCPSVIRGWRSAQNTCLHLSATGSHIHCENFLNDEQRERWENGKMRFVPGPSSVIEVPLNIGFVKKSEQTGHPAQKPLAVIEPLIKMATEEGHTILDPMCGSGTTGEACLRLGRNAILCDNTEEYLFLTHKRISKWYSSNAK